MWLNRLSMPILDKSCIPCDFERSVLSIKKLGMEIELIDLTNDTEVPVIMALCFSRNNRYPSMLTTTACHPQADKAIEKALLDLEALLQSIFEHSELQSIKDKSMIRKPFDHCKFYLDPSRKHLWEFMLNGKKNADKPASNFPGNPRRALETIVKKLNLRGHTSISINITPPDIIAFGPKVVKVFVTNFQPIYFHEQYHRLSLSRLTEVPKKLVYHSQSRKVKTFNMSPHPLA
jgi:thiazole/oxazole-forming peptide maturase SagD family component